LNVSTWHRNPPPPKTPIFIRSAAQVPYSTNGRPSAATWWPKTLSALDIPYIALNPGASYRGLHDSLVNFLGNEQPQMILCLHEEAAVAIAHGYQGDRQGDGRRGSLQCRPVHATMAIFNAWCDRSRS